MLSTVGLGFRPIGSVRPVRMGAAGDTGDQRYRALIDANTRPGNKTLKALGQPKLLMESHVALHTLFLKNQAIPVFAEPVQQANGDVVLVTGLAGYKIKLEREWGREVADAEVEEGLKRWFDEVSASPERRRIRTNLLD